jgi:hypothetical protein
LDPNCRLPIGPYPGHIFFPSDWLLPSALALLVLYKSSISLPCLAVLLTWFSEARGERETTGGLRTLLLHWCVLADRLD